MSSSSHMKHRRQTSSPVIEAIGSGNKVNRKRGKGKPSPSVPHRAPKPPKPSQRAQSLEDSGTLTPVDVETLKELLAQQLGVKDEQIAPPSAPKPQIIDSSKVQMDAKMIAEGRLWKSDVAHQSRNAVVKILTSVVEFDWEQPFRRSDSAQAIGSGFFVSADGIIVTNAHVVEEAAKVWITVPSEGERRYDAEVLGICFDVDLALLKAKGAPVAKFLEFGDSNEVQYGQEVLTLGYPLGMESLKLTEGIISGREESYFQTDAPLNPGNSGGPMLNSQGKVIGVNVAIAQSAQNVGFAIPIFQLTMIFETLKNRPKDKRVVHKPILGADFSNSTDALTSYLGVSEYKTGYYVSEAYEGFPLYNAGVRAGDILHKFNGFELDNFGAAQVPWSPYARASLDSLMGLVVHDSKPEIEFSRNGKLMKATLNFEDPNNKGYPILPVVREIYPPYEKIDYEVIAGLVVMDITMNHIALLHEEQASETVIKNLTPIAASFELRMKPAVVVSNVLLGSLVARSNTLTAGTILDEVNGIKVSNLKEFREAIIKPVKRDAGYFITLLSRSHEFVVLPLEDSIREEFELGDMHMFDVSPLVLGALTNNPAMLAAVTKGDKAFATQVRRAIKQAAANHMHDDEEDEDVEEQPKK